MIKISLPHSLATDFVPALYINVLSIHSGSSGSCVYRGGDFSLNVRPDNGLVYSCRLLFESRPGLKTN